MQNHHIERRQYSRYPHDDLSRNMQCKVAMFLSLYGMISRTCAVCKVTMPSEVADGRCSWIEPDNREMACCLIPLAGKGG